MSGDDPIVFVVDDDESMRRSLQRLLRAAGIEHQVFASALGFLETPLPDRPGCLVLDIRMPGMDGMELQAELQRIETPLPIIFVTGHGDVPMSVQAMKAGAVDFLLKPFNQEELLAAIHQAVALDRQQRLVGDKLATLRARFETLTPREREVLVHVVSGALNKQIAYDLGIQEGTIKVHRRHVMEKMQADSLAQLVRMAEQLGIGVQQQ